MLDTDLSGWPDGMPDVPDPADEQALQRWCRRFNGYDRQGSFDACAAVAKARPRQTLDDLLTEYFFALRAARHRGDDGDQQVWAALLPHLRHMLATGLPLPPTEPDFWPEDPDQRLGDRG
jgi:hypothetical protein